MLWLYLYLFLYCNIDNIFNKLYFSIYDASIFNNEMIINNSYFYYSINNICSFILCVYCIFIMKDFIYFNSINKYSMSLSLIYIKYLLHILLNFKDIHLFEYEINRIIMWLFSTPLMLKMYCEINNMKIQDIKIHYHIVPLIINVFIYPYKNTMIHSFFSGMSYLSFYFFMKNLFKKKNALFTNVYFFIWCIFVGINMVELTNIIDKYTINLFYIYADVIGKMTTNIIVHDYNEREINMRNNMDLQSINFITYMLHNIKKYYKDNSIITNYCNNYIQNTYDTFISKIPENKDFLEKELLKKILPFGFDKQYIENVNANIDANVNVNANTKHFNMICILFTDIVNYTELAKQYDDKIIFNLLNSIYNTFDNIIKKYAHLQKIETIGDAYMVVGDIYRNTYNHKTVIKEIILLSIEFIKEIKKIETPNKIPLSIRIGINMGNISIGILGHEIPRLCIVGNSVNITSRLQSTADINTIQVSKHIYEQLSDIYFEEKLNIMEKENVFLKNIGTVTTYVIQP